LLWRGNKAFLDDLVEFASVQPDPAAFRAVVYFDVLPLRHDEIYAADRTKKGSISGHYRVSFRYFEKLLAEVTTCSDWRSKPFFASPCLAKQRCL
jgi:hypothetical protein